MLAFKPGQPVPKSGQYGVKGPKGGDLGKEVTVSKGDVFPPTVKPGQTYVMNDPSNNKSGK